MQPRGRKFIGAPVRVGEMRVAAVDEDVSGIALRAQMLDDAVDRTSGGHHDQDTPRPFQRMHERVWRVHADDLGALGGPVDERFGLAGIEVVAGDRKSVALDVPRQISTHHAEPDDADLCSHRDIQR